MYSTAGNATLVANAGIDGGDGGGIAFGFLSKGGTPRVKVFGNAERDRARGVLSIAAHSDWNGVTIGSIEGDGLVLLGWFHGAGPLIVGSNNLSTTFAGTMKDGYGVPGEGLGALGKIGTGTLTLSGKNSYTGPTTISAGTVIAAHDGALGRNVSLTAPSATLTLQNGDTNNYLAGDQVVIGGFIITGIEPKKVLIRGLGPSLSSVGVGGVLANPTLELHQGIYTIATNDNWKTKPNGLSQQAEIEATTIPPTNDLESAIVATLGPGAYTAILSGQNGAAGVGLVEVYDLERSTNSKLANISTRAFVDAGDNVMIGGLIVAGSARTIVRALGPSVPVAGALADPTLELRDGSGPLVASNDNWKTSPEGSSQQAEIEATSLPPPNDSEAALVRTLPPGNYTAIVRGLNDTTGIGLVEVYHLP